MGRIVTPQMLTDQLAATCGDNLRTVMLYGSAAAGDHAGKHSDYNVLVVLDRLGVDELNALAPIVRPWIKAGNPPPLLLMASTLAKFAEVFPLEFADIKEHHQVLSGDDVVASLAISSAKFQVELEYELREKLILLRQQYLLTQGHPKRVTELMTRSLSSMLVLCRGALRLFQSTVPAKKMDALAALTKHVPIDTHVFETIAQFKRRERVTGVAIDTLFADYLRAMEAVTDAVDRWLSTHREQKERIP